MTSSDTTKTDLRKAIAAALSRAGSFCGDCGFEPGDEGCPDCKRHWNRCAKELLPVIQGARDAHAHELADRIREEADGEPIVPVYAGKRGPVGNSLRWAADLIDPGATATATP